MALVEPDYKVKVYWDGSSPPDDPNFGQEVRRAGLGGAAGRGGRVGRLGMGRLGGLGEILGLGCMWRLFYPCASRLACFVSYPAWQLPPRCQQAWGTAGPLLVPQGLTCPPASCSPLVHWPQWHIPKISALQAWRYTTGSAEVKVGT